MLNVYEQVSRNKRRSTLIVFFFIVFVLGVGWLLSQALDAGVGGLIIALLFAGLSTLGSYFAGDKIVLAMNRAKEADKKNFPTLVGVVENLALGAQIPTPKVYVIPDQAINAFATGRDPKHASVAVTQGALDQLSRTELEGVLAHELSHITNFDTRLFTIVALLIGMISILADFFLRSFYWRDSDSERQGGGLLTIIGLLLAIFAPLAAQLIQLAISRQREFLADATGVKLTRQPEGLIGALEKIGQSQPLRFAQNANAHFYIANPFSPKGALKGIAKLFNTHPPLEERIAALKKMS